MRPFLRHLRKMAPVGAVAAALAVGLALLLQSSGRLEPLELIAYDAALTLWRSPPRRSERVTIVAIDDKTFQTIAASAPLRREYGQWPYVRKIWGEAFAHLHALGAKAVLLDAVVDEAHGDETGVLKWREWIRTSRTPMYIGFTASPSLAGRKPVAVKAVNRLPGELFSEPAAEPDPSAEAKVGPATASAEDFEDGEHFEEEQEDPAEPPDPLTASQALAFPVIARGGLAVRRLAPLPSGEQRYPVFPIRGLLPATSGFGLVDPEGDPDGKLRRTRFAYSDGLNSYAMLSVAAAADVLVARAVELAPGELRLGDRRIPIDADGSAELDFGGTLDERFATLSLIDVVLDANRPEGTPSRLNPALIKDRVIAVGGFAVGTWDKKATPYESDVPGVVKQAAELDALLGGRFIRDVPEAVGLGLTVLVAVLSLAMILGTRSIAAEVLWPPALIGTLFLLGAGLLQGPGRHLPFALPVLSGALACLFGVAINHLYANRESGRIQQIFSRYLSGDVVKELVAGDQMPTLAGEQMLVTAFFSDIRGFSTFSERYKDDPRGLVALLNTYLTRVSATLHRHGATLDKYIGDAVVCLFGAPVRHPDHAVRACAAALAVQEEIARLREEFSAQGLPDVYTRIGLNSAVMLVGNIGSEQLFNYTAIGDGMNLASRLEGANKAYATLIMIGQGTYDLAREQIEARELDWIRVAGKHEKVAVYELLALKGGLGEAKRAVIAAYAQALALYREGRFEEAAGAFERTLALDGSDGPAQTLLERCRKFSRMPPAIPFDGVVSLDK